MNDHTRTPYFPQNLDDYAPWVAEYGLLYPYGECQCGCGNSAPLATQTDNANGRKQGQPNRYCRGHQIRIHNHLESPNPSGLCMCGCGQPAPIATESNPRRGRVKGLPMRYISGHFRKPATYQTIEEHFWAYCTHGDADQCWDWQASTTTSGYGRFNHRGQTYLAHRVSWELHFGPIPKGMNVCHKCDRPCCNNPNHFFLGTQIENLEDMHQKKRHAHGTRQGAAKLNPNAVRDIRKLAASGISPVEIGKQFKVARETIRAILDGKTWTHVI